MVAATSNSYLMRTNIYLHGPNNPKIIWIQDTLQDPSKSIGSRDLGK